MGLRIRRWLERRSRATYSFAFLGLVTLGFIDLTTTWVWTQVVLALSLVIFVHELGHFLVAKWCGVQCDKFFIGFDIFGLKLSKKWGETEYGIGILPLGGYVKMLGQEDNPSKIQEEIDRAKAENSEYEIDPRSYLAKSVPQRMAIISAGVIMNVIFAWVVASIAYGIGVEYVPGEIGGISSGGAAWQAGVTPGDSVQSIADVKNPDFRDLRIAATFKDDKSVPMTVSRDGEAIDLQLEPTKGQDGRGILGVEPVYQLKLSEKMPAIPETAAAEASAEFLGEDIIVAVNGREIHTYFDWRKALVEFQDQPLQVKVRRTAKGGDSSETSIDVAPEGMRRLGIVMTMGQITAVRKGSIAEQRGIRADDVIREVKPVNGMTSNDDNSLDPIKLPERLRKLAYAGVPVNITLERGDETVQINDVVLDKPAWEERSLELDSPVSVPALGVAYSVINRIHKIEPGSPAAELADQLPIGAEIRQMTIVQQDYPEDAKDGLEWGLQDDESELDLTDDYRWPFAMLLLQNAREGATVRLSVATKQGDETSLNDVTLTPFIDPSMPLADRGINLQPKTGINQAESIGGAMMLGLEETGESLTLIYKFLKRIPELWRGMGGPISIVRIAGDSAERGLPELLIFIAMLSANLAVINFLPIPVLDGGHFVFLTLEGIRGKPVSERVFLTFSYLGLAFLLALMVFTIGLDISRLVS